MYGSGSNTASERETFQTVTQAARTCGFEHCSYEVKLGVPVAQPRFVLLDSYDRALRQLYQRWRSEIDNRPPSDLDIYAGSLEVEEPAGALQFDTLTVQLEGSCGSLAYFTVLMRSGRDRVDFLNLLCLAHLAHWRLHAQVEARLRSRLEPLSPREIEVLSWTADGKTSGDIAALLHLSENTVNFHFKNAKKKVGASSKTSLVVWALQLGMLRSGTCQ